MVKNPREKPLPEPRSTKASIYGEAPPLDIIERLDAIDVPLRGFETGGCCMLPHKRIPMGKGRYIYLKPICPLFCLQKKVFSNQNKGRLGSMYLLIDPMKNIKKHQTKCR